MQWISWQHTAVAPGIEAPSESSAFFEKDLSLRAEFERQHQAGDRTGGELAWELAATRLDRFIGLVVIDRGHPRVPDQAGVIRDEHCPPVELNTTALVSTAAARTVAKASQRYVYGEFRLVELLSKRNAGDSTAQVAAEIVMRTSTW